MENKLRIVFGDCTLGVHSSNNDKPFSYIFSYAIGGMESMNVDGFEWLYRSPSPTFYRALTSNDNGCGFGISSGMWLSADRFIKVTGCTVAVDGKEIPLPSAPQNNIYSDKETCDTISIEFTYETITVPSTTVFVKYSITSEGNIEVTTKYTGNKELPSLPVFGLRMIMPTVADGFVYSGLSGETYPDRMAGGIKGIYEIEGLPVTPHLMPQDCGMHMATEWVEIKRSTDFSNRLKKEPDRKNHVLHIDCNNNAFSCLPYTCLELDNATHMEELPLPRRTVLCIYGAIRGIGGIDSWGSSCEDAYKIDASKDIEFTFCVRPFYSCSK